MTDKAAYDDMRNPCAEALFLTEYANTGWRAECFDCYESNLNANT